MYTATKYCFRCDLIFACLVWWSHQVIKMEDSMIPFSWSSKSNNFLISQWIYTFFPHQTAQLNRLFIFSKCLLFTMCFLLTLKVPITTAWGDNFFFILFFIFQRKQVLTLHVNCLLGRRFTWNIKTCFPWKIKKKNLECRLLQILLGGLMVKKLHIINI